MYKWQYSGADQLNRHYIEEFKDRLHSIIDTFSYRFNKNSTKFTSNNYKSISLTKIENTIHSVNVARARSSVNSFDVGLTSSEDSFFG